MDVKPPPRHRPSDLAGYLEALSRPVFQAGMSWRVIDAKATIDNAQALLELDAEYGGFGRYLGSHGGFTETVRGRRWRS